MIKTRRCCKYLQSLVLPELFLFSLWVRWHRTNFRMAGSQSSISIFTSSQMRESNPGRGGKREGYLCAKPSPRFCPSLWLSLVEPTLKGTVKQIKTKQLLQRLSSVEPEFRLIEREPDLWTRDFELNSRLPKPLIFCLRRITSSKYKWAPKANVRAEPSRAEPTGFFVD